MKDNSSTTHVAQQHDPADWLKQHPPLVIGAVIEREIKSGRRTQAQLAAQFGTSMATISRFRRLHSCRDMLPECWRHDLETTTMLAYPGPVIRMGHWILVAGFFGSLGAPAKVLRVLEKCYAERWSSYRLKNELKQLFIRMTEETSAGPQPEPGSPDNALLTTPD